MGIRASKASLDVVPHRLPICVVMLAQSRPRI